MLPYLIPIIVSSIFAVAYRVNFLKLGKTIYGAAFFAIAVFAGLGFEMGMDWDAYDRFFSSLNLADNPFVLYFDQNAVSPKFEIGFYLLNYVIKYVGGTYSLVLLLASVFCAYSVYTFTKNFAVNKFYILTIYFTHAFIILHFAQVRQSIAIGFFLLGCTHYLKRRKKLSALTIAMIGPLFQISSLIYVFLLTLVFWWPEKIKSLKGIVVITTILFMVTFVTYFSDAFTAIIYFANATTVSKIEVYRETQIEQSTSLLFYLAYLSLVVYYIFINIKDLSLDYLFIFKFAIASLLLSVLMSMIFPGVYAMYSRIYVVASIFQALALSLIFSKKKGLIHDTVFVMTILVSIISYYRILDTYKELFIPYQSIIG